MQHEQIQQQTANWVVDVVVGLNFCPFARRELDAGRVRYQVCDAAGTEQQLYQLLDECRRLDADSNIETTLFILPQGLGEFDDYLNLLTVAENLLTMEGYEGVYQLASFHPDYCFADAKADDPANYTNRSPYPMLHIIREESLERAVAAHPEPDMIPERNVALARSKGLAYMQALLERSCK